MDGIPLDHRYTWTGARRLGVTRRQIAQDGVEVARGLYVSRSVGLHLAEQCAAWSLVLPADAAFSHATAAALYGAPVGAGPLPHAALTPRRVLPQWTGPVVHGRRLQPQDVVGHRGLRLTSGAQTFLDLSSSLSPEDLVAVGDALLRAGHT